MPWQPACAREQLKTDFTRTKGTDVAVMNVCGCNLLPHWSMVVAHSVMAASWRH